MAPHPVVAPKAATPGSLTRPAAANRGKLTPRVRVPDTDRISPCAQTTDAVSDSPGFFSRHPRLVP